MTAALSLSRDVGLAVDALRDAVAELAHLDADTAPMGAVVAVGLSHQAHHAAALAQRLGDELMDLAAVKLGGPGLYEMEGLQLRVTTSKRARCHDVNVAAVDPEGTP